MAHRQQERLCHKFKLKLTTYSLSFPTCLSHPGGVPLLFSTVLRLPQFLFGLQQQDGKEVSEPCSCSLEPSGNQFPINSLTQREIVHGPDNPPLQYPMVLTTHFFNPYPKLTIYTKHNGHGYKLSYSHDDMKDSSIGV
jgi:hypothetical protein